MQTKVIKASPNNNCSVTDQKFDKPDDKQNDIDIDLDITDSLSNKSGSNLSDHIINIEQQIEIDDAILLKNGYRNIRKIIDTLQGCLYEAVTVNKNKNKNNNKHVAIKKANKKLHSSNITIQNGVSIMVQENIIKEAILLHHLTVSNHDIGGGRYINKFIDFFESNTAYYLVVEYIDSHLNFRDFAIKSHQYIRNHKLKLREYTKMIKYLFWQLSTVIYWLHNDMNVCHLDLSLENIMVHNADFVLNPDGSGTYNINPNITIKLCDFGIAEAFKSVPNNNNINMFKCDKNGIMMNNERYSAPKVFSDDIYDARKADMWSLGIIIYYLSFGIEPYNYPDYTSDPGYRCIVDQSLMQYLINNGLSHLMDTSHRMELLNGLLQIDEHKRFSSIQLLQTRWFKNYWKKYKDMLQQKSKQQKDDNKKNIKSMINFPFYGKNVNNKIQKK